MKAILITTATLLFLLGMLGVAYAQGDDGAEPKALPLPVCCPFIGILMLLMAAISGYAQNKTIRKGYAYVPRGAYNGGTTYSIKEIDDGRLVKEHDNRQETGYW